MEQKRCFSKPKVGDKCTMFFINDRNPCQVVRVSGSGKTVWVKRNKTQHDRTKEGGMGHQNWLIFENVFEGDEYQFSLRKNKYWIEKGDSILNGVSLHFGVWEKYYCWEI